MVDLAAENPRLRQTFLAVGFCAEITVVHLLVRIFTEWFEGSQACEAVFWGLLCLIGLLWEEKYCLCVLKSVLDWVSLAFFAEEEGLGLLKQVFRLCTCVHYCSGERIRTFIFKCLGENVSTVEKASKISHFLLLFLSRTDYTPTTRYIICQPLFTASRAFLIWHRLPQIGHVVRWLPPRRVTTPFEIERLRCQRHTFAAYASHIQFIL